MGNKLSCKYCFPNLYKEDGQVDVYDEPTDRSRIKDTSCMHTEIQVSNNVKNWDHPNIEIKEENKELPIVIFIQCQDLCNKYAQSIIDLEGVILKIRKLPDEKEKINIKEQSELITEYNQCKDKLAGIHKMYKDLEIENKRLDAQIELNKVEDIQKNQEKLEQEQESLKKDEEIKKKTEKNKRPAEQIKIVKLNDSKVQDQVVSILKNNEILCEDLRLSNVRIYIGKSNKS